MNNGSMQSFDALRFLYYICVTLYVNKIYLSITNKYTFQLIRLFLSTPLSVYILLTRTYNEYVNYKSVLLSINHTCIIMKMRSNIQGIRC